MKAVQLVGPGKVEIRDLPEPEPAADQVLVQVLGAGMCHSDINLVDNAANFLPLPMTLGHESTGRVVALGDNVSGPKVGDNVLVGGVWGCGHCFACSQGRDNVCELWAPVAPSTPGPGQGYAGGMAEYMVAPAQSVIPIGDIDPVLAAPLADAGITSAHAINMARSHLTPEATAVVIGMGGLGHLAVQILRATTACRIIVVDNDASRRDTAVRYGAHEVVPSTAETHAAIRELTNGLGAQAVFDFVGIDATLELAMRAVAKYGALVLVGLGGGSFPIVAGRAPTGSPNLPWGVTLVRPFGATRREVFEVLALARRGQIRAEIETHGLEEAVDVLHKLGRGEVNGRAVLVPQS